MNLTGAPQTLSTTIPVIGETAYRSARLKLQRALSALALNETQRALAVADFSVLYRSLPDGQRIDLAMLIEEGVVHLDLRCAVSTAIANQLQQVLQHFDVQMVSSEGSGAEQLHLFHRYIPVALPSVARAQESLLDTTTDELQLQAKETEAANAAKREFLSRMSHELRTPMNAIIGMTHLALRTDLNTRQRDYLNKINTAGQNLLGIINDILDFSKIEAGKITLEATDFRLDRVLGDVASLIAERIFSKGVELLFSIDEQVPHSLRGDPLRLTQILLNLLSNAAKFTEVGEITLRVSLESRTTDHVDLVFEVQDTGIGMSEHEIAKLFQAFSQADVSTTRRYGGTGLGLSICQKLLELMGGSISVSSRPGEGSCFQARARFQNADEQHPLVVPQAFNQLRVLAVDDNPLAREVIQGLLAHLPMHCELAESAEQTLAMVHRAAEEGNPYGLLLLDWKLGSDLDGLELARELRSDSALLQPRIVLVTAYGRDEASRHPDSDCVDAYLSKPIQPSSLIDTLTTLFAETDGQSAEMQAPSASQPNEDPDRLLHGLRVLLVEDNPINREIACELLEIVGIDVATANNGIEALDWLESHSLNDSAGFSPADHTTHNTSKGELPCDLVLLDLNMPEMDGWECIRRIRSQSGWDAIPVLAMTAHAMQQERDQCLASGMQDHITKPIDPDHLYRRLRHWGQRRASAHPEAATLQAKVALTPASGLQSLKGFDWQGALRRVGGNEKLYRRLLLSLLNTQADASSRLDEALAQGSLAEARHIAHTIKGVAANLGASALADVAGCLEAELTKGLCSPALREQFQEQLQQSLGSVRQLLSSEQTTRAPVGGDPETADGSGGAAVRRRSAEQQQLLQHLEQLLASADGESLELADSRSEELIAILGSARYGELHQRLQNFDFAKARDALKTDSDIGSMNVATEAE